MIRKWIKRAGERIEDRLRHLCGALSPDKRVIAIITLFVLFAALSLYSTVSAFYSLGRNDGSGYGSNTCDGLHRSRSRGSSRNPSEIQMQSRSRKQPFPLKQNEHSPGGQLRTIKHDRL